MNAPFKIKPKRGLLFILKYHSSFEGSVFDLIPEKDKEKMETVKNMPGARPAGSQPHSDARPAGSQPQSKPEAASNHAVPPETSPRNRTIPSQQQERPDVPLFRGAASGFKPFASNPQKQERYERFLQIRRQGKKCKSQQEYILEQC